MKYFAIISNGIVQQTFYGSDDGIDIPEGAIELPGPANPGDKYIEASGAVEKQVLPVVIRSETPAYVIQRRVAYPKVEEQLDMLWKAMAADPSKRIEPFYGVILAIKSAYPKTHDYVSSVKEFEI